MHSISKEMLDFIKKFEGFSSRIYLCPAGYKTIGYGHLVLPEEEYSEISEEEAEKLLIKDLAYFQNAINCLIKIPLELGQYTALLSFTYNLGVAALERSTLRQKVNREEHETVPEELRRWVWAGGKKLPGLIKRRIAEGVIYQFGCDNLA